MQTLIFLIALSISSAQPDVHHLFSVPQQENAITCFESLDAVMESSNYVDDSVIIEVQSAPAFLLDTNEQGVVYELVCFDNASEDVDPGVLFSEPERIVFCQQYEDDDSNARMPVRSFMNLGKGNWMQVNHFEDDRSFSITENPEVFVRIDSVFVSNPLDNVTKVHVLRFRALDGR